MIFLHCEEKQLNPQIPVPIGQQQIENRLNKEEAYTHFKIRRSVYEEMISYCQKVLPYEACGLLSGDQTTGNTLWKMKNESYNLNRFYMSAGSIKHAFEQMEEKGEELSGIFHSHPSSQAVPSSFDIENNPYPDLAYIIVSFYKGNLDVGCFRIKSEGKVLPLELIVIEE